MNSRAEMMMTKKIHVMYVDDEPDLLTIGRIFLEKTGSFLVTTANSASDALSLLETEQFDAIISDYQMPEIDGLDFLKQVRLRHGSIPFILFTGRGREEVVIRALNEGADFYLQKGGDLTPQFAELSHKVRQAVQKRLSDVALRESEEKFRVLADTSPVAIIVIQGNRDVYVNDYTSQLTGYTKEEHYSMNFWDFIHPNFRDRIKENGLARLQEDTGPRRYEIEYLTKSGEERWADLSAGNILYEGLPAGIATLVDITERKRAEYDLQSAYEELAASDQELRAQYELAVKNKKLIEQSEADYRSILENIQDVYYRTDNDGRLVLASPSLAKVLGYSSLSELYGQDVSETMYCNPGDRKEMVSGVLERGSVTNYECILKKRDGTPITVLVSSHTYHDASGNVLGIEGIFRDITDRKKVEIALQKSENLYRTLFDMTGSGTIIIDENTVIILANSGFARLSGYSIEELEGKRSWNDFVAPEDLRRMNEYHYRRRSEPESAPRVYEFRFISRHGEIRHCICNVGVIPGSVHSVASVVDITGRVLAEEAMKKSENQYRAIFENSCAPTILIAPDMTILHANAGWVRLTGVPREQQENKKKWTDFADREEVGRMLHYHRVRRENPDIAPQTYDCRVVDGEGKVHYCFVNVDMIQGSQNSVASLVDVTNRILIETELEELQEIFRALVEKTHDGIIIADLSGKILFSNQKAGKILGGGKDPDSPEKITVFDYVIPECREKAIFDLNEMAVGRDVFPARYKVMSQEKKVICIECNAKRISYEHSPAILFSICEFTRESEMGELLEKSKSLFRQLEEQLPDYIIIHDGEIISFVNAEAARLIHKTPEELVGASLLSFVAPEYHDLIRKNIALRYKGVQVEPYEIVVYGPSGEPRWVVVRAVPIPNPDRPTMLTVLTDISTNKHTEEALRESEAKYRSIFENMQDLFYRTDLQGNITMVSPLGIRLAGFNSPEDVLGRNVAFDIYADPKERELFLAELTENGVVTNFPIIMKGGDGSLHYTTVSSHYFSDANGNKIGVEGIIHDITDRKRVEEALIQTNRKLNLLSGITRHDINNQLTILKGYLDMLDCEQSDLDQREYYRKAITAADNIASMIEFTKEYESIGVSTPTWQDIRTLVSVANESIQPGHLRLQNDITYGFEIFADPLIFRVIYNLMDNAVRYSEKIPNIRFSLRESGDIKVIVCEDDGVGVRPDEKEKIFERGYGKNTGLGLALSREILNITRISLRETGEAGYGARFEITVPRDMWRNTGNNRVNHK